MKKLISSLLSLLFLASAFSQTPANTIINDPNAEVRNVASFTGINVSNGIELTLKQGNQTAVAVSASDISFRDRIRTTVENGVLKIWYDNDNWRNNRGDKKLRAYVSVNNLEMLKASSGALVKAGRINSKKLEISLSSGSNFNGEVQADELNVDQNSGTLARLAGKVHTLDVGTTSGSTFNGYDLQADACNAHAASGGQIEITVNQELGIKASSGGSIRYKGAGVIKNVSTNSGGSVSKSG